jgi:hypothetical protein
MDILFRAHEFAICRTSYSNGSYEIYNLIPLHATLGFMNPQPRGAIGEIGPTGPTGSIGCYGYTGPNGSQPLYQVKSKKVNAYKILCRPRENSKESYESLIVPFLEEYNDVGVRINVVQPDQRREQRGLKPEFQDQFDENTRLNMEVPMFNECIQYLFDMVRTNTEVNIELYLGTTQLSPANQNTLRDRYQRIVTDFTNYREHDENDDDGYDSDDDYYNHREPYVGNYRKYENIAPSNWFEYETIIQYNNGPKLEIYAHQGTELYGIIQSLIPAEGGFTKSAR